MKTISTIKPPTMDGIKISKSRKDSAFLTDHILDAYVEDEKVKCASLRQYVRACQNIYGSPPSIYTHVPRFFPQLRCDPTEEFICYTGIPELFGKLTSLTRHSESEQSNSKSNGEAK